MRKINEKNDLDKEDKESKNDKEHQDKILEVILMIEI